MVAIFHKIISFFLALIVLFASFSFTVNKHICGGEIASIAFFVSANTCGMDMSICENDSKKTSEKTIQKEPCCKNVTQVIQGNDNNQQAQQIELNFPQIQFIKAFVYSFVLQFQPITSNFVFKSYSPPSVYKDLLTFFQIFRI
jgi:hypothetical protein